MKTIKERNDEAFLLMKQKFQDYLDSNSQMSVREVFEFARAYQIFNNAVSAASDDFNIVCCHLLAKVDTEENGIGEQPRYKLIREYDWAFKNAIRDWNNRYEMGN